MAVYGSASPSCLTIVRTSLPQWSLRFRESFFSDIEVIFPFAHVFYRDESPYDLRFRIGEHDHSAPLPGLMQECNLRRVVPFQHENPPVCLPCGGHGLTEMVQSLRTGAAEAAFPVHVFAVQPGGELDMISAGSLYGKTGFQGVRGGGTADRPRRPVHDRVLPDCAPRASSAHGSSSLGYIAPYRKPVSASRSRIFRASVSLRANS